MKTAIFFLLSLSPILAIGQWCDSIYFGKLKAEVYGDSVVIKDDTAYRGCGVLYAMEFHFTSPDTLIWMQRDTGEVVGCLCHFNLSMTIDSLKPGNYTAKTYYSFSSISDTCYIGSVSFIIAQQNSYLSPFLLSQEQSQCLVVGVSDKNNAMDNSIKIYPNPADDYLNVITDLNGEKLIRISSLENKCVFDLKTNTKENIIDLHNLPKMIYFITVRTNDGTVHSKFIRN